MADDEEDEDAPGFDRDKILLAVARLIWKEEITLGQFYDAVGVDFGHARSEVTSELSGIMTGWSNPPDHE